MPLPERRDDRNAIGAVAKVGILQCFEFEDEPPVIPSPDLCVPRASHFVLIVHRDKELLHRVSWQAEPHQSRRDGGELGELAPS